MSGGAYNYLFMKGARGLISSECDLDESDLGRMITRFHDEEMHDVARDLRTLQIELVWALRLADMQACRLAPVMQAMEWRDSGDWGDEELQNAVTEYREQTQ